MKKQIIFSGKGKRTTIGSATIDRILPHLQRRAVGSFVFLDHLLPQQQPSYSKFSTGAHPHRGIATLTYILEGEDEHFDSAGNCAKVHSGGVQWMKAGNGILHNESLGADALSCSMRTHAFQFWINLPAANKTDKPAYLAIQANEVPQKRLSGNKGWIKVITGDYEEMHSAIPAYLKQFIYHVHLEAGEQLALPVHHALEAAAFLPSGKVVLNGEAFTAGEWVVFDSHAGTIEINNAAGTSAVEVLLFGGEKYREPVFAEGPFVMNSAAEIAQAYRDFHEGKYGVIKPASSTGSLKFSVPLSAS